MNAQRRTTILVGMTDYLFTRPSFLSGMARSLDLAGVYTRYNVSRDGDEADRRALAADVAALGADFRLVLAELDHQIESGEIATQPPLF